MKEYNPTNKDMFNSYLEMGYKSLEKGNSKEVEMFYTHAKSTLTELLRENFLRKDAPQTADENLIKKYYIRQFGKFCKAIDIRNGYESFPMKTIPKRPIEKDGKISHIYSKETLENLKHLYDEDSNKNPKINPTQKLIEYFSEQKEISNFRNSIKSAYSSVKKMDPYREVHFKDSHSKLQDIMKSDLSNVEKAKCVAYMGKLAEKILKDCSYDGTGYQAFEFAKHCVGKIKGQTKLKKQIYDLEKLTREYQVNALDLTPYEILEVKSEEISMRKSSKIEEKLTNIFEYSAKFLKNLYSKTQENNLEAEPLPENWNDVKKNCDKYLRFKKDAKPLKRYLKYLVPTTKNKFTLRPNPVDLKIARYLI
jgi:hypothetical protein